MTTRTTQHLREEHRKAARLLAAFRRYLHRLESSDFLDAREPSGLIDFLAESLFQRHEEKEEGVLLPELSRMGLSWSDGTLAQIRQEHRQGSYLLRSLKQAMRQGEQWSLDDRAHFFSVGTSWVDFIRDHMMREERVLFPFVDRAVDEQTDEVLVRQFEAIDREYAQMGDAAILQASSDAFLARFGGDRDE